jgi:hypothetical protein
MTRVFFALFSLFLLAAIGSNTSFAEPVQWSGNGHRYEAFAVPDGISWTDASANATTKGGYLATITSAEENAFVYSLVQDSNFWFVDSYSHWMGPWLGGYQQVGATEPAGGWNWITGETWSYTNWGGGNPNDGPPNQDRVHFIGWGAKGSTWNDLANLSPDLIHSYVVESVPEPSTFGLLGVGAFGLAAYTWRKRKLAS